MDMMERMVSALEALTKEKSDGLHTKSVGSTMTASLLQQPGGMFAVAGMEPEIISLNVSPRGLGAYLPALPSSLDDPRYGFLVGFSDDIGAEAETPCGDAPTGYMKAGTLTSQFGRIMRQTNTIEIDKLLRSQRGVNTDIRLMNNVLNGDSAISPADMNQSDLPDLVVKMEMVDLGVRVERKMSRMVWSGVITNNTAGGGYKEFPGLDVQIATGLRDAETNTLMPSADSLIYNFGYSDVDGTAKDIVECLSSMEFYLRTTAEQTNMLPCTWAVVMRPELWQEISAVWPCRYLSYRCDTGAGTNPIVINDNNNIAMRDAMRNGRYIDINGNRYAVILDDGIYEHTNATSGSVPAGFYASSIYFVPLRVRGSFPVLYWEHIDYRMVQAQIAPMGAGTRNVPFWTDNGRFLWVYRDNGYCFDLQAKVEPRIILRAPHLAGKIQSVRYSPMTHLRSPYPDSPYWLDGGVSLRSIPTSYANWK